MSENQISEQQQMDRVEALMEAIEEKRATGLTLTPLETRCAEALDHMIIAEAEARDSFSRFYAALPDGGGPAHDTPQLLLPNDTAFKVNAWIEARKRWETVIADCLATLPLPGTQRPSGRRRTGQRLRATLPTLFRIPATEPARDALSALFAPHRWRVSEGGTALSAQMSATQQVVIECDDMTGFGPERAAQQIARHGASAAQTFLAMAGLWQERNPDRPHETYLTAHASDLLRYQQRRETPRGGYHRDDLLAKARDVYLLSRISLPRAGVATFENGQQQRTVVRSLSLGRLLSLESLEAQETTVTTGGEEEEGAADMVSSLVQFRYHLGREVYEWVCGENPQYQNISGKILTYHPVRQKYQILLGFCLAYYDRVSRRNGPQPTRPIRLPALLDLAAIPLPEKRIAAFLSSIEEAIRDLARDGVIPGARLQKPADWADLLNARRSREIIAQSVVVFDPLPLPPSRAAGPGS